MNEKFIPRFLFFALHRCPKVCSNLGLCEKEMRLLDNLEHCKSEDKNYVTNDTYAQRAKAKVARCELLLVRGGQGAIIRKKKIDGR